MKKNVIIFGADMSSSVHVDNKGKHMLILVEGATQGLDDTTLTAEAKYPINFTQSGKRFALSLQYNGSNSFLFVKSEKVYQFKAKNSEIKDYVKVNVNLMEQNVIQINGGITITVDVNVKNIIYVKKEYVWNPSTCICENGKYLASIMGNQLLFVMKL